MEAKSFSIATAVTVLFITGGAVANASESTKAAQVRCSGINSWKGQSFCATAKNACAGQNACKGQGWLKVSRKECLAKGGRVLPDEI
jgi:hypothetical protein